MQRSSAISYVEENSQGANVAIAYAYCEFQDTRTHSDVSLMNSIIRQLADQCEPLPRELTEFRDKWVEKKSFPGESDRVELLKAISSYFERTYIFIDALVIPLLTNNSNILSI